ncbi:MAG: dienelactone hydrolase family protein [Alphaproteobacteria bacterium]|nr:dienelactone hydrolase family protein [Alphaproteobacteria bacterium]
MSEDSIRIPTGDGRTLQGYLAVPATGSGPGILLIDDQAGNDGPRPPAELYAAEGYVVLYPEALAGDEEVAAVIAALRERGECTGGVAVLGFGHGAMMALRAAAEGRVACAVCYCLNGIEMAIELVPRITCPVGLHFAGNDPAAPPAAVARLKEAVANAAAAASREGDRTSRPEVEIHIYPGAAAGFARRGDPHFDRAAAGLAHSRSVALLRRVMGPHYDLEALWEAHIRYEFETRDVAATMATMVPEPYVNHVPVMTGGVGQRDLARFYANHFIPKCPADISMVPVSRTIGADRIIDEMIVSFTHDIEIDWMLPGVPPTGRHVEIPLVAIVGFRGDKLYHEHIYWDQASVLVQIGLLDPKGLPVSGAETAKKLLDETLPSNTLMKRWSDSAPTARGR